VYAFEEARRIGRLVIGGVLTAAIIVGARSTRSSLASRWLCTRNRPFTPPFPIRGCATRVRLGAGRRTNLVPCLRRRAPPDCY